MLQEIAERIRSAQDQGVKPAHNTFTIREVIRWFHYERRSKYLVNMVRNIMDDLDLRTVPDFEFPYIDTAIRFELVSTVLRASEYPERTDDPTVRIGALPAANNTPTRVRPDNPIATATTLMLIHDYSQLPVISGERELKGVVSWKSIGSRLALGHECNLVKDCIDPASKISIRDHLFDAIRDISENGYVLVEGKDKKITGIVTASDLVQQFQQLTGPFLIVGEIEGYLRKLIQKKFTIEELRNAAGNGDGNSQIEGLADLTFGNYKRLLEDRGHWTRLGLMIDRAEFVGNLDGIRNIRNDVMHFSPDGLDPADIQQLQDFARFLRDLDRMGAG